MSTSREIAVPVEVRLPNILRPVAAGEATVKAEGTTVGEVFDDLVRATPRPEGLHCSRQMARCTAI